MEHPRNRERRKLRQIQVGTVHLDPARGEAFRKEHRLGRPRRRGEAVQVEDVHPGLEEPLAAWPAPAANLPFPIGHVVVGQFLTLADVAGSPDPDDVSDDVDVAVALARVIDEARDVAAHVRIAHPAAVDLEAPDGTALHVTGLALQALLVRNLLACIVDDPGVLGD